jgi:adenosylhomocysteine nucleosidase
MGSAIVSGTAQLMTDQSWSHCVLQAIPDAVHGMIVEVPAPIMQPQAKRALFSKIGAVTVDTESHIAARVAAKHRLPMVAMRVTTDPTDRRLPRTALAMVHPNWTLDMGALIRSILKQPHEAPALLRTALDAAAAHVRLLRNRQLLGRSFGLAHSAQRARSQTRCNVGWPACGSILLSRHNTGHL